MKVSELKIKTDKTHKRVNRKIQEFEKLISELNKRELPEDVVIQLNTEIELLNAIDTESKKLKTHLRKSMQKIIKILEKSLNLVVKNHYQMRWMVLGLAVFGVPFGVIFGNATGNMGLLGIGIPIGMIVGMAIGAGLDKKALSEGRQLDVEIKM